MGSHGPSSIPRAGAIRIYLFGPSLVTTGMSNLIAASQLHGRRPNVSSRGGGFAVLSEENAVLEVQKGNLSAFGLVYEEYFGRVFRYVYTRIGSRQEAEDLAGEVSLKALQAIGSYKSRGVPISAWLFRIAHNQVVDHLCRRSRRRTEELDERLPMGDDPVDAQVAERMTLEDVRKAIRDITEAQQMVISLRFGAELFIAETAQAMGKKEGVIKALQHSAVQALRRRLQSGGYGAGLMP